MAILITSFVDLYVKGVTDINYHRPIFGYIISAIGFFYAVRIPYESIIRAAGHFKQTRNGAIFEASLNIILSFILVIPFGMIGLAIGTLVATIFRTIQYGIYTSKNIVDRSFWYIVKRYFISFISIIITILIFLIMPKITINNFVDWIINGLIITSVGFVVNIIFNIIFYKDDMLKMIKFISRILKINIIKS